MADRRTRILNAAANLFAAKGYSSATMSDVVAAVGGSKATLYRHFPSKEALLHATLEMAAAAEIDRLQALLDRKDPIADRIRDFTFDYLEYLVRPEVIDMRRLVRAEAGRSDIGRKIYEEMVVPAWARIAAMTEQAMNDGALRQADPWRTTMHLKSLIEGYLPDLLVGDAIDPVAPAAVRELATEVADVFLRAFRP